MRGRASDGFSSLPFFRPHITSHICAQHTHLCMSFASIVNIPRTIHSRFLCLFYVVFRISFRSVVHIRSPLVFYVSVIIRIMSLILGSCNCFSHANYFAFFSLLAHRNRWKQTLDPLISFRDARVPLSLSRHRHRSIHSAPSPSSLWPPLFICSFQFFIRQKVVSVCR